MVDFENVGLPMTWLGIIFVMIMVLIAKGSVVERRTVPALPTVKNGGGMMALLGRNRRKKR
jgi:hypothetical protein